MRVLQVIDILNVGGAERVFVDMVNILSGTTNVDVEVLLFYSEGELTSALNEKVKKNILGRTNKYSIDKLRQAHKICRSFDIVHVHMRYCYAYIRLAQIMFGGKYKIILHDHYGDIEINKNVPARLRYLLKPKNYVGVSQSLVDWASANFRQSKVFLLRNIVAPQKNASYTPSKRKRAFMVANIRKTKNIEFAIALCKKLGWSLDIYGNKTDEAYWRQILPLAGKDESIRIIQGEKNISKYYGQYRLALHTSYSETGPLALLEYMAQGVPFVSYNTGEVAKVVSPLLPYCFVNTFNIHDWEAAITKIVLQEDLPEKMRNISDRLFSMEKYKDECLQIYESVSS